MYEKMAVNMTSLFGTQTMFTVEQIELIRRLRNSGITKEQLVKAFDSLERLDKELGHIYSIPLTFPSSTQNCLPNHTNGISSELTPFLNSVSMANALGNLNATRKLNSIGQVSHQPLPQKRLLEESSSPSVIGNDTTLNSTNSDGNNSDTNLSSNLFEMIGEEHEDFQAFIRKGDLVGCEEIKNFVIAHNIKQQQVAILAGVSQSYVSRYLKGDHYDMSERSRHSIIKWYLTFKDKPELIAPMASDLMLISSSNSQPKKLCQMDLSNITPAGSDAFCSPRRERFVFRPVHLELLEKYFVEDSYPSQEKRDEIAKHCNAVMHISGRPINEKELVSPQVIANWFANKRKEIKKMAKEEGIDPSYLQLRGKGRPTKSFSSVFYQNGDLKSSSVDPGVENSNDADSGTGSPSNEADSGAGSPTLVPSLDANNIEDNKLKDCSQSNSVGNPQEFKPNEEAREIGQPDLSEQVEFAAVSQAIISLTGKTNHIQQNKENMQLSLEQPLESIQSVSLQNSMQLPPDYMKHKHLQDSPATLLYKHPHHQNGTEHLPNNLM